MLLCFHEFLPFCPLFQCLFIFPVSFRSFLFVALFIQFYSERRFILSIRCFFPHSAPFSFVFSSIFLISLLWPFFHLILLSLFLIACFLPPHCFLILHSSHYFFIAAVCTIRKHQRASSTRLSVASLFLPECVDLCCTSFIRLHSTVLLLFTFNVPCIFLYWHCIHAYTIECDRCVCVRPNRG